VFVTEAKAVEPKVEEVAEEKEWELL